MSRPGRIMAKSVMAAAAAPGVLVNVSTVRPKAKPHSSRAAREVSDGSSSRK